MRPRSGLLGVIRGYVGAARNGVGRRACLVPVGIAGLVRAGTWIQAAFIDRRLAATRNGKRRSGSRTQGRRQRIGVGRWKSVNKADQCSISPWRVLLNSISAGLQCYDVCSVKRDVKGLV